MFDVHQRRTLLLIAINTLAEGDTSCSSVLTLVSERAGTETVEQFEEDIQALVDKELVTLSMLTSGGWTVLVTDAGREACAAHSAALWNAPIVASIIHTPPAAAGQAPPSPSW